MFMCKMVRIWEGVLFFLFFFKLQLHSSVWATVINSGTVEVLCPNLLEQKSSEFETVVRSGLLNTECTAFKARGVKHLFWCIGCAAY